jgi:hypothetical protein
MYAREYGCPECGTDAKNLIIEYDKNQAEPSGIDLERLKTETTIGEHIRNIFYCPICDKRYTVFQLKVTEFNGSVEEFKKLKGIV